MSNQGSYIEKIKGHKSDYDPKAWGKMRQVFDAQARATQKRKKRYVFYRIAVAAMFIMLISFIMISDGDYYNKEDSFVQESNALPEEKSPKNPVEKGSDSTSVTSIVLNVSEENKYLSSSNAFNHANHALKPEYLTPSKLFSSVDSKSLKDPELVNELPVFRIDVPDYMEQVRFDSIHIKYPEKVVVANAKQRENKKIPSWKIFLTAGFLTAKNSTNDYDNKEILYGGIGFNLSKRVVLQAEVGENYFNSSLSYLFGDGRLKFGPELGLLVVKDALGPSFGAGAYYHTSEKFRFFTRFSRTNFRFFGEGQSTVSKISLGAQVSLGNFEKWQRRGFSQRGASNMRRGLSSRNNEEWDWFGYSYAGVEQLFGRYGNVGIGAGKHLTSKSYVQLGLRLPVRGYQHERNNRYLDNAGLQLNYNLLLGEYRWYGLIQAGINLRTKSSGFLSGESAKGAFATNLGVGVLYKTSMRTRLYLMFNVNDPYTSYSFWPRASFQIGAHFKL